MLSKRFSITREIGIDAGHRIPDHGSKCKSIHGHRYRILATCSGPLVASGEQNGMVLDFGFLKEEMMNQIDAPCDHGLILSRYDPLLGMFIAIQDSSVAVNIDHWIGETGYYSDAVLAMTGKIYIVPFVPTAENLARHWFERLGHRVMTRSQGLARLTNVQVWETPNCMAEYPGPSEP